MPTPPPPHLDPSELGTKAYWDATYTSDLSTSAQTPSHTGTDWFSDVNASDKILRYIRDSTLLALDKQTTSFLDLGTGNGEMLFLLREQGGFEGRMMGVDYSAASIELCERRLEGRIRNGSLPGEDIEFREWNVLSDSRPEDWKEGWDVILDKGTFDAVSLSEERDGEGKRVCEGYRGKVEGLVKRGGVFVVTSCNWTEEELQGWFGVGELKVVGRVEYPVFRFGGGTGQSVVTVCFRKG